MKNIFFLFSALVLMTNCKTAVPAVLETPKTEADFPYYFKATGNEPFWSLRIGADKTVFTSMIENKELLEFKTTDPVKAMDANVKTYHLSNAANKVSVTIMQNDCQDSMSGVVSPYTVKMEIKNSSDLETKIIQGCGRYITDYRLHDIWVLEELKGKKVSISDFQNELPRIEINASENTFMGFGGCNSVSGSIFSEKELLRFTNVISTLMACAPGNKEDEYLKALQSSTSYEIGNNRLTLSNPSGVLLIFRKVD